VERTAKKNEEEVSTDQARRPPSSGLVGLETSEVQPGYQEVGPSLCSWKQ